jgi:hypothetical protein
VTLSGGILVGSATSVVEPSRRALSAAPERGPLLRVIVGGRDAVAVDKGPESRGEDIGARTGDVTELGIDAL